MEIVFDDLLALELLKLVQEVGHHMVVDLLLNSGFVNFRHRRR